MRHVYQPPSIWYRSLFFILKVLFLTWLFKSAYLFFLNTDYTGHHLLARSYLAMHDGLVTLPETIVLGMGMVLGFVTNLNFELTRQLGYSPFSNSESLSGGYIISIGEIVSVYLFSVIILSIVQLVTWLFMKAKGVNVFWRSVGIPDIYQANMKFLYWIICWLVIAFICLSAFYQNIITAFVMLFLLMLTMRFPIIAGVLLLIFDILKVDFSALRESNWRNCFKATTFKNGKKKQSYSSNKTSSDQRKNTRSGNHGSQNKNSSVIGKLGQAYATFDLKPEAITRDALRSKYRVLMRKLHPDQEGSSRLAGIINSDYDTLLSHHGWKR